MDLLCSVFLPGISDEQAGQLGSHGGNRDKRYSPELCSGKESRICRNAFSKQVAQGLEDVRLGGEAILVDVVGAGSPAPEGERAMQYGNLGDTLGNTRSIKHAGMVPCVTSDVRSIMWIQVTKACSNG